MGSNLPWRLRLQFAVTKRVTAVLAKMGLREPAISLRIGAQRFVRECFERCGSDRLSHPSLHGMDRTLDSILDKSGGFFVEAGGFDGYTQSNTYFLERFRGWRGVLVEPMPELAAHARRNRPDATIVECALVGSDHPGGSIEMEFADLMTTVRGLHEPGWSDPGLMLGWRDKRIETVVARRLSDILDEVGSPSVDLLSLDVEGYEASVLDGLDLARHAPSWILIEMHDLTAGRAAVAPVLGDRYVEHAQISPVDVLYRRADIPQAG